jgi:hypothetical protein
MKKLIAISITLALVASAAFAQVSVGGWGRADFIPFGYDGTYSYANTKVNWGNEPNFALNFSASGEQIGLVFNFDVNPAAIDGNAYVWWKPLEQFQLDVGRARWDVLRGPDAIESFHQYSNNKTQDEDAIFTRFTTTDWYQSDHFGGAVLQITPIENLYIGVAIPTGYTVGSPDNDVEYVYKRSSYAAGYNIDGIGLARVGYFGESGQAIGFSGQKETNRPKGQIIQGAFKLTAVEAIGADFGFTYALNQPDDTNNIGIALRLDAKAADGINIGFTFNGRFGGDNDKLKQPKEAAPFLAFYVNPEFDVGFATVGLGLGLDTTLYGGDGGFGFGGNVHISKNVGGGTIKAGVAITKEAEFKDMAKGGDGADSDVKFAIPIQLTYSFF